MNATCFNDLGGYGCRCNDGFTGNGYTCTPQVIERFDQPDAAGSETVSTTIPTPNFPGLAPEEYLCDQCSENARCENGVCICKDGWNGNGFECLYNCPDESFWNDGRCEPIINDDMECKLKSSLFQLFE